MTIASSSAIDSHCRDGHAIFGIVFIVKLPVCITKYFKDALRTKKAGFIQIELEVFLKSQEVLGRLIGGTKKATFAFYELMTPKLLFLVDFTSF